MCKISDKSDTFSLNYSNLFRGPLYFGTQCSTGLVVQNTEKNWSTALLSSSLLLECCCVCVWFCRNYFSSHRIFSCQRMQTLLRVCPKQKLTENCQSCRDRTSHKCYRLSRRYSSVSSLFQHFVCGFVIVVGKQLHVHDCLNTIEFHYVREGGYVFALMVRLVQMSELLRM